MSKKENTINRRPESRTFDPIRYERTLRNGQTVILLVLLVIWLSLHETPDFSIVIANPIAMIGKLCMFALGVWLVSALKEGLRCLGFRFFAGAKKEYIKLGIFWSRGGAVFGKCMAAIDVSGYRLAVILPALILAWIPWLISLLWGNLWLYSACAILVAGTWNDICVLWSLRCLPHGSWVQDSPFAPGCDVYIPES